MKWLGGSASVGCAKTAEPIEMQIGCRLVRANTTNSVLGCSLITPGEKALVGGHTRAWPELPSVDILSIIG